MGGVSSAMSAIARREAELAAQAQEIIDWAKSKKAIGVASVTLILDERKSKSMMGLLGALGVKEKTIGAVVHDSATGKVIGIETWVDSQFSDEVMGWFIDSEIYTFQI